MTIDRDTIGRLARLSQLELSDEEVEQAQGQLSTLLEHFAALAALDTDAVEASPYPAPTTLRGRPDEFRNVLEPEDVLRNAPTETRADQFVVPKVVDR